MWLVFFFVYHVSVSFWWYLIIKVHLSGFLILSKDLGWKTCTFEIYHFDIWKWDFQKVQSSHLRLTQKKIHILNNSGSHIFERQFDWWSNWSRSIKLITIQRLTKKQHSLTWNDRKIAHLDEKVLLVMNELLCTRNVGDSWLAFQLSWF